MAHTTEINVNGVITPVVHFDHSAQEIDDAVARVQFLSNHNLLDNWYFGNPVNQMELQTYSASGYTIDRWKLANSRLSVTVGADGLTIARTATGSWASFRQYFEKMPAGTYTVSFLVAGMNNSEPSISVYKAENSSALKSENRIGSGSTTKTGVVSCTFTYTPDAAFPYLGITIGVPSETPVGGSFTLLAAKLELGTTQTLAHQENGEWVLNEIPNYAEELAKCQRYYQLFTSAEKRPSDKRDFRPELRTNATSANTGTIAIGGVTYYYADANL